MKKIEEMELEELYNFRNIVVTMNDKLSKDLTTYSITHNDKFFERLSAAEEVLFEKKNKLTLLLSRVDNLIDEKLQEYYA